jgi:hypothetical protein
MPPINQSTIFRKHIQYTLFKHALHRKLQSDCQLKGGCLVAMTPTLQLHPTPATRSIVPYASKMGSHYDS